VCLVNDKLIPHLIVGYNFLSFIEIATLTDFHSPKDFLRFHIFGTFRSANNKSLLLFTRNSYRQDSTSANVATSTDIVEHNTPLFSIAMKIEVSTYG